jgi:hypothetical protein
MTTSLLAFMLALQRFEITKDLEQLASNCEARNWSNIKRTIEDTLKQYPELKGYYEITFSQLQTMNSEELQRFLPSAQTIKDSQPKRLETLGCPPAPHSEKNVNEIDNLVVEVAIIILQDEKPSEMSKKLLSNPQKDNQKL